MPGFDLTGVLDGAMKQIAMAGELRDAALDANVGTTEVTNAIVKDAQETAQAAAVIEEQKQRAVMQQESTRLKIANRMGTNANDAGWVGGKLADRVKELSDQQDAVLQTIQAKQSVNLIDNPLGWIYSQATVDGDIGEFNGLERRRQLANDTLSKLEQMTSAAYLNNNALAQTVTDATIQAGKITAAHQFNREANVAKLEGIRTNLQGMQIATQASAQQVQMMFEGNSAIMRERQYDLSLEHLRMAKDQAAEALKSRKDKADQGEFLMKLAGMGYFAQTGTAMPDNYKRDLEKMYAAKVPQVMSWVDSGLASYMADPTGSRPIVSNSPFDVTSLAAAGQYTPPNAAQKQVADQLVSWRRDFDKTPEGLQAAAAKDRTTSERAFNSYVKTRTKMDQANVTSSSVYSVPALTDVAAANPNVAAMPLWQTVLQPLATAGAKLDDPNFVFNSVASAVKTGKISYQDAVDGMSTAYGAGVLLNNQSRNFIALGMPPATNYNVAVKLSTDIFGKSTINMADRKDVARYLNSELAKINTYASTSRGSRIPYGE